MVIKYKDKEITTLEDIQKLKVKELRDILKCNSERAGGTKADLVLKVYALLVRNVVRPAENELSKKMRIIVATLNTKTHLDGFLLLDGLRTCVSYQNLTLSSCTTTSLYLHASTAISCLRVLIIKS